jgi:hypothetical protein
MKISETFTANPENPENLSNPPNPVNPPNLPNLPNPSNPDPAHVRALLRRLARCRCRW